MNSVSTFQSAFIVALGTANTSACDTLSKSYVKSTDLSFLQNLYSMNKDKVDSSKDLQAIFNCVDTDVLKTNKITWVLNCSHKIYKITLHK